MLVFCVITGCMTVGVTAKFVLYKPYYSDGLATFGSLDGALLRLFREE